MVGKCHICGEKRPVTFCSMCGHFFCGVCKNALGLRVILALIEFFLPARPDCCGVAHE